MVPRWSRHRPPAHVPEGEMATRVTDTAVRALAFWQRYRDGVAERMTLSRERAA